MPVPQIAVVEPNPAQRLLYQWELGDDGYEIVSHAEPDGLLRQHALPAAFHWQYPGSIEEVTPPIVRRHRERAAPARGSHGCVSFMPLRKEVLP